MFDGLLLGGGGGECSMERIKAAMAVVNAVMFAKSLLMHLSVAVYGEKGGAWYVCLVPGMCDKSIY